MSQLLSTVLNILFLKFLLLVSSLALKTSWRSSENIPFLQLTSYMLLLSRVLPFIFPILSIEQVVTVRSHRFSQVNYHLFVNESSV